jgi:hypothetical protein
MRNYPTMPRSTYLWLVAAVLWAVIGIDGLPRWSGWVSLATAAMSVLYVVLERRRWAKAHRLWRAQDAARAEAEASELT